MGDAGHGRQPLKIAIVGGGIGGLSLLLGILNHCDPQAIQPHLYEAAQEFSEIGAGLGLLPNAVRAMHAVDPKLREAYGRIADRAPPANVDGRKMSLFSKVYMGMDGRGGTNTSKAFDEICDIHNSNELRNVHRAVLLDEMVKLLPGGFEGGLVSFRKRCTEIQLDQDGATISFADDTSVHVDAVIGCDGVKSRVRNILHAEQEEAEPQFTGKYAYRGLVPAQEARDTLGEAYLANHVITLGYGGHLVTFPINHGKTLNIVAFQGAPEWTHGTDWVVPATVEDALEDFQDWSEPVKRLLALLHKPNKWGIFDLPPLKTFIKDGRICLLGDCAHSSSPHQGAGAGMAIEDAAVLSQLLGEIKNADPVQLKRAFAAYDMARRERTQKVVTTSRRAGLLFDFERPDVGDDVSKIQEILRTQWNWIWDLDIDAHCKEAIDIMRGTRVSNKNS